VRKQCLYSSVLTLNKETRPTSITPEVSVLKVINSMQA
jgi:hypothetical protein